MLTDTDTLVIRMHLELNRMISLRREITVNGDECERCSKYSSLGGSFCYYHVGFI